ncbi:hypothetical protein GN958_ATG16066 [Phytophthora infestans]|uniref:M96 mating-specific protein family n=1 Tax=Phytophthora infestans TaxID=4787 RepID=A0A8S9U2H1_PHYIN|nr:hypothetical protein GN958_ATG16066 [Phytophthora infestans]
MSVLIEDAMPTVGEVVAFIDSWDTESASPGDVTSSESENENMLLDSLDGVLTKASFLPKKQPQPNDKLMKKKRKKTPGASTRLQRRKKAEILALRAQSEHLEGRLGQLMHKVDRSDALLSQCGSFWAAVAATQFHERLQAEVVNQRLRTILTEQMKCNKALREVFRAHNTISNLDAVVGKLPGSPFQYPVQYPVVSDSFATIGELEKMVEDLYIDSAAVFQPTALSSSSCELHVKQEQNRAQVYEISSTTSLPCSIQETCAMFWRDYLTVHHSSDKSYHFIRQRKPASVEKSFKWLLQSGGIVREVNGFSFVRKIEEPNRVVLVEADRLVLPSDGIQIRIQRWTIIKGAEDGSDSDTLIQLRAECTEGLASKTEDLQDVEDLVLGVLSMRLREYLEKQQERFSQSARMIGGWQAH